MHIYVTGFNQGLFGNVAALVLMSLLAVIVPYLFLKKKLLKRQLQLENSSKATPLKYGNNRLPKSIRKTIAQALTRCMEEDKPWLNVNLSLNELAEKVNVNSHHLSQVINCDLGKSFQTLVNEYRLQYACNGLLANPHETILTVALASGFSSKSTFNMIFKKSKGITPTEYRKKYQNSNRLLKSNSPVTECPTV